MKRVLISLVCVAGVLIVANVRAGTVTLNFDSLPSAQGWTFSSDAANGYAESQGYSIANGMLHQDTISIGSDGQPSIGYYFSGSQVTEGYFRIDFRARVTASQMYNYAADGHPEAKNVFGFFVGITGPSGLAGIGISTTEIDFNYTTDPDSWYKEMALMSDNTTFHDYCLEGTLSPGGSYRLYRDGVFISTCPILATGFNPQVTLELSDGTNGDNAIADVTAFSYTNVPEPATVGLLALGGMILRSKKAKGKR